MSYFLEPEKKAEIARMVQSGYSTVAICESLKVSRATVCRVKSQLKTNRAATLELERVSKTAAQYLTPMDIATTLNSSACNTITGIYKASLLINDEDFMRKRPAQWAAVARVVTENLRDWMAGGGNGGGGSTPEKDVNQFDDPKNVSNVNPHQNIDQFEVEDAGFEVDDL